MMTRHTWHILLLPLGMALLTILMFLFPQATYDGARYGLETWALTLVPSLLPFMIASDMLIQLGVVNFLGVLLEPLMRPLFRLPGSAGFVVAMGFTSGFPMGALLTESLYEKNLCTKNEAARLVAFTNNASPLFLLVAIPISMLKTPEIGWILLAAHYSANLLIGLASGFFAPPPAQAKYSTSHLLTRSIQSLIQSRNEQTLPIGTLLGNAVGKGIKNILSIGGFVLFFSVIIQILSVMPVIDWLRQFFAFILSALSLEPSFATALSNGLFEMTLGTKSSAQTAAPLGQKLMLISFILGWSGLSIHAQVASIITRQHIPLWPYLICRPLQGILAAGLTFLFFHFASSAHTVWFSLMLSAPIATSSGWLKFACLMPFVCLVLLLGLSFFWTIASKIYYSLTQFCQRLKW